MSNNQQQSGGGAPQGNNGGGNAVQKGIQKAQKAKQTAQRIKKIANAIKNISSSGPLMYVLFWVFVVIVALIIIIGIIMFLVTMPGMVMEKLKALFKAIGNYVAAFFGADTTQQIDDVRIYETLDYIEDMGWELKGEGFLTSFYETGMESTIEDKLDMDEEEASYDIDDKQGVVRNGDGNIILADSDFIFTYIMSDNYVYTLKNKNLATNSDPSDSWLEDIFIGMATAWYKIKNLTLGPIFDAIGLTNAAMDKWGKGLIGIYYDKGLGIEGTAVNTGSMWNWDTVEINTETKKLSIARNKLFNANNNAMQYSLDGWTGRYGMPLEFLLSVHKATMMPDLAFDMVTTFPTEIHLLLHKASGESIAGYKNPEGTYVEWDAINEALSGIKTDEGWKWLRSLVAEIANWFSSDAAKVQAAKSCGADVGMGNDENPNCTCTLMGGYCDSEGYALDNDGKKYAADGPTIGYEYDENNKQVPILDHEQGEDLKEGREAIYYDDAVVEEACERCTDIYNGIYKYLGDNTDYNYITYIPYISKVTDHWYRDVYFVLNSGKEFVDYDYDYESVMKERWTLYETYTDNPDDGYKYNPDKVGEFIVFEIDEKGEYKKNGNDYVLYDGTFDEARGGTLYKKENGEYKVYTGVVNENGKAIDENKNEYTLYMKIGKDENGADKYKEYTKGDTIAVAKKAITVDASDTDTLKDLGWEKSGSVWTAYEEKSTTSGFERLFPDEEITEEKESNETYRYVMSKCYINLNMNSNIVQVGEGQRTETNPDIKKMFLQNKYFRYDGSTETADIITEMREKLFEERKKDSNDDNNYKYGAVSKDEAENFKITRKEKNSEGVEVDVEYHAKDYTGTVLLNQDSLNAFAMLENTHTLDSDFIYRDFKELVVELGYFEKEELAESKPRLLQFPIPEIGSMGYPDRTIDKREAVEGTMIHSKHDIDANKKYTLKAMVENATNAGAPDEGAVANAEVNKSRFNKPVTLASSRVNNDRLQLTVKDFNLEEVGAMGGTKKPEQIPLRKFLEETEKMCKFIDEKGYNYCVLRKPTDCLTCSDECKEGWTTNWACMKHSGKCSCKEVHCDHQVYKRDTCGLSGSFLTSQENPTNRYDTCCNFLVSWAFQNVGLLNQNQILPISTMYEWALQDMGGTEIQKGQPLKPGDILFYDDWGHVDLVAEKNGNSYLKYNGGHYVETGAQRGTGKSSVNEFGGWTGSRPPEHVVRLNWGDSEDGPYKGYLGNEAVVSPVTGILMEYGTYPIDKDVDEDGDGELDKEERINVDLKYGPSVNAKPKSEGTEGEPVEGEPAEEVAATPENDIYNVEKRDWADEVGYATIFVLNKEAFEMLDEKISHRWRNVTEPEKNYGEGLVSSKGQFYDLVTTEKQLDELTKDKDDLLDETVYAYKEFTEMYERYGIAGYFVYIDGFKCELPDTSFVDFNEDKNLNDEAGIPKGTPLTFDSFKIREDEINGANDQIQTLFEAAEQYKVASKKATEKLNVEEAIKIDAYPALTIDNPKSYEPLNSLEELVFIKEGTVIGRTFTDKELVEERQANGDEKKYNFEYYAPTENVVDEKGKKKNMNRVVGNYLMIKLLDPSKPIENVEDYMKIDEDMSAGDQEYQFREGDLEILADAICHEGCGNYCANLLGTSSPDDKLYLAKSTGFTIINKLNSESGFIPDYNDSSKLWDASRSPLYNLLCRIPSGYDTGGYTTGTSGGWYAIALGLRKRVDADELQYCDICFEAAEYIRDNDSMNFTNNGKFGAQYSAGEGMPHTMWEQGGGYYDEHKLWLWIDKNNNGNKDLEEKDYYLFDTDE